jgi:hypothetical protein
MSDGPYRSLPMPPRWKKAAKCAYLPSFTPREIADALEHAAERDCRAELSAPFVGRVCALIMPNNRICFVIPPSRTQHDAPGERFADGGRFYPQRD